MIHEFYVNLPKQFGCVDSPDYRKVHVRGRYVMFSAALINKHLDRKTNEKVTEQRLSMSDLFFELTGRVKKAWSRSGQLSFSNLNVKYALLHKIGVENWCPSHKPGLSTSLASLLYQIGTRSPFDYGVLILNQVTRHIALKL